MKLFKTIDEKFAKIGFEKISENKDTVIYKRKVNRYAYYSYIQTLILSHALLTGKYTIHSYDESIISTNKSCGSGVCLTSDEIDLCIKKMKSIGWI